MGLGWMLGNDISEASGLFALGCTEDILSPANTSSGARAGVRIEGWEINGGATVVRTVHMYVEAHHS